MQRAPSQSASRPSSGSPRTGPRGTSPASTSQGHPFALTLGPRVGGGGRTPDAPTPSAPRASARPSTESRRPVKPAVVVPRRSAGPTASSLARAATPTPRPAPAPSAGTSPPRSDRLSISPVRSATSVSRPDRSPAGPVHRVVPAGTARLRSPVPVVTLRASPAMTGATPRAVPATHASVASSRVRTTSTSPARAGSAPASAAQKAAAAAGAAVGRGLGRGLARTTARAGAGSRLSSPMSSTTHRLPSPPPHPTTSSEKTPPVPSLLPSRSGGAQSKAGVAGRRSDERIGAQGGARPLPVVDSRLRDDPRVVGAGLAQAAVGGRGEVRRGPSTVREGSPGGTAAELHRTALSESDGPPPRPAASTARMRAAQWSESRDRPTERAARARDAAEVREGEGGRVGAPRAHDDSAAEDLFAAPSSEGYVDEVVVNMTALYVSCLSRHDISRLPFLADSPPTHVCLRSMPITTSVVANVLSYCNHYEIHDLMLDNCVFTLFDYTWFKRIKGLRTLRLRGSSLDTRIITQVLAHATQVETVTLFECAPITALPALASKTCRIESLQLIRTSFTEGALADMVNSPTVREVLLLEVEHRFNAFELFNTGHIDTLHLVACPDLYYEPKPEREWLSTCSPRAGGGGRALSVRSLLVTDCESLSLEQLPWGDVGRLEELSIIHREQQVLPVACLHSVFHSNNLRLLRLQHVFVDEYVARQLQLCGRLEELNLSYCKGFVEMNEVWRALTALRRLNVSHSEISSDQLAGLHCCAQLEHIFAQRCPYIEDFDVLRALPRLELVDLTGCAALRSDGFSGQYACGGLRTVILDGCTRLRDVSGLAALSSLEVVRMRDCHVREKSVAMVLTASVSSLVEMDISETDSIFDLSAVPYEHAGALTHVSLAYSNVVDGTIAALGRCPRLHTVDLSGCENITTVAALGAARGLRVLNLSFSAIDSDGIAAYTRGPEAKYLEQLRLRGCTGVGDLSCLGKLRRLVDLDLSESSVDAAVSLPAIAAGCAGLGTISLSGCANVRDISALGASWSVHRVNASLTDITDGCLGGLATCQSIEELDLSGCTKLRDVSALSALTLLQRLNLSSTTVDVSSLAGFGSCTLLWDLSLANSTEVRDISVLSTLASLQRLDVSGSAVDDRSFAVPWRTSLLEVLDLSGCTALASLSAGVFQHLTCVRRVDLSRTAVDDASVAALASCATIEEVVLSDCAHVRSLACVAAMRNVCVLRAPGTAVDDASLADLRLCGRLALVDLSRCPHVHNPSELGGLSSLRTLLLAHSGAGDVTFPGGECSPWCESPLETLDLSGCAAIRELPGIAAVAARLVRLDLSGSGLTDAGLAHVAELTSLCELRLAECQGLVSAQALSAMPALRLLDMSRSSIERLVEAEPAGGAGPVPLLWATQRLRRASFARCARLSDVSPLRALPALTVLDLSESACVDDSFGPVSWARCTALQELRLRDCTRVGNITGLRAMSRLVTLDIAGSAVSSASFAGLSECTLLELVDVSRCAQLTSVQCLSALPRLRRLRMRGSGVTCLSFEDPWTCPSLLEMDARDCQRLHSLTGLSWLPALRRVVLANSSVTDAGLRAISKAIRVEDIDVSGCVSVRSATALSQLTSLRRVDLSGTLVDNTTLIALPLCGSLEELNLSHCDCVTSAFLAHDFPRLRVLRVPPLDRVAVYFLRHCPSLEVLSLPSCPDAPRTMSSLVSLPHLQVLDVSGSELSREVFHSLVKCALLSELDLSGCVGLEFLHTLSSLPYLKRLRIAHTAVGNEVCAALAACSGLQSVNMSYCAGISDVAALAPLRRLRFLDASGTAVTDGIFTVARALPSLEELLVRECAHIMDASALAGAPRLRRIDAASSSLVVGSEQELRTWCPQLREVNLSGCKGRS